MKKYDKNKNSENSGSIQKKPKKPQVEDIESLQPAEVQVQIEEKREGPAKDKIEITAPV